MSEKLKTIKELADELGISKQGVQYHLNYYHLTTRQKNNRGIIILTHEEQEFVRNRVRMQSTKDTSTKDTTQQLDRHEGFIALSFNYTKVSYR